MSDLSVSRVVDPCLNCITCARASGLHLGNHFIDEGGNKHSSFPSRPEWNILSPASCQTHTGMNVMFCVSRAADIQSLVATPEVFPLVPEGLPNLVPHVLKEFTDRRGLYYPYVCHASYEGMIVARLYIDPNPENAIVHKSNSAVIDNVNTHFEYSGLGIADKLLEFAENFARSNQVRWLEIGCIRDQSNTDSRHSRRGVDSLRLYLRRGYHHNPTIVEQPIRIHYQVRDLPGGAATVDASRYEKALVVYKDLDDTSFVDVIRQRSLFEPLVAELPL